MIRPTVAAVLLLVNAAALAQQAPAPGSAAEAASPATGADAPAKPAGAAAAALKLEDLAWLEGCWQGSVNRREYREVWLPLRGRMMVGVSQTVLEGRTEDFEYLRLENRGEAVNYVAAPGGRNETAFRLVQAADDAEGGRTFVFSDPGREFPQRIAYRRGSAGWLYAEVAGKVDGKDKSVVYPMRRIDCGSGALIEK